MSNLQNTTRLPLRATMTNKWKSQAVTNDLIERKTRALEGGLNKLKFNTQGDQTKPTIDTYRRNGNKDIRDKSAVNLFSTKSKSMIKCGQCERVEAKMKCLECVENYCDNCFSKFHLRGALQRHHCVSLSISQKKTTDINLRALSDKQSKDNLQRKSNINETEIVINEKTSLVSFQQSFLQWRDNNINKSQRMRQKHGLMSPIIDRIDYSNKLPYMESNSSNKYQHTNKHNQESFIQQSKKINLNEPIINSEPLNDDLSTTKNIKIITSEETLNNDEQERPITHISIKSCSRPISSTIKKDPITSRPNSTTLIQQSLRSLLNSKSTDELEAIVDSQVILSRPTSSTSEQPIKIDQNKIVQVDLFDQSAYRLNYSSENIPRVTSARDQTSTHPFCINSTTTTPRRNSPFSFSNSLYKLNRINSSSSRDTADGGFFTDVLPRQIISSPIPPPPLPPPILECSTSNEWKYALENQSIEQDQTISNVISLRKNLSRPSSKHSITREGIYYRSQSQINNNSRPNSSLSSASLPISITSSKADFNNSKARSSATSSRKSSSSSTSTLKKSSSLTPESSTSATKTTKTLSSSKPTIKNSSFQPEPIIPIITEVKKETSPFDSNESHQESMQSLKDKSLFNVNASENSNDLIKPLITREENITENDLPAKKRTHRRVRHHTTNSDDSLTFRKLEFSVGDGLKWQEASVESMSPTESVSSEQSSNDTTPRSLTPSNPINTKLAEQFQIYDNDDGRSSRAYQNMNDEECFNQLCNELCSQLDITGSNEDAIFNDHIVKILRSVKIPFNEKDLIIIETKLH